MVDVASSSVGSLMIRGKLDDSLIQQGFSRIKQGFEDTKSVAKGLGADMQRLGNVVGDITKSFIKISSIGLGALTGLAMASPALAGSLARIRVELFRLGNTFGQYLRPLIDSIANDLLPSLVRFVENNRGWIETMFSGGAQVVSDFSSMLSGEWRNIENILPKTATGLAMGSVGFLLGGPIGGFLGFSLGWGLEGVRADTGQGLGNVITDEAHALKSGLLKYGGAMAGAKVGFKMGGFKGAILGFALGYALGDVVGGPAPEYSDYGWIGGSLEQRADRLIPDRSIEGMTRQMFTRPFGTANVLTGSLLSGINYVIQSIRRGDISYLIGRGGRD